MTTVVVAPILPAVPGTTGGPATVAAALAEAAGRWPGADAVEVLPHTAGVYGIPAGTITYQSLHTLATGLRAAYRRAGYGPGHRVGLLLENRPAFFAHWFALNGLGVSVVPINADLRAAELEYLVGHSEIALAVALPHRHADLAAAAATAGRRLPLLAGGALESEPSVPPALCPPPLEGAGPGLSTECALLYTSGTTGRPKGCVLTNRYFLHSGGWYAAIGELATLRAASPDGQGGWHQDRMLTPLPLVHMNAMAYSTLAMVLTGGCLVVLDRFHPSTWWDNVRAARASVVHYLGVMPSMLMKAAARDDDRAHAVRFGFGAGVDRALHAAFEQRFGFPLLEAWAMTETGAGAVVMAHREPRHVGSNCFGRECDDVEVRVVADHGGEAAVDEPGELWVRHAGPDPRDGFFAEYLNDPTATAEAWAQGWFHTGDIVRRGADGQLHFIDRRKNVIRRSGENIAAVEVESVLNQHPAVRTCAVAATPDELRGDEVLACIVPVVPPEPSAREALAHDIVGHLLQRLAYFKVPGWVAFVDALPLTASNKIQRGELKALARDLPGQPHCVDTRTLKKRQG
jgi:acyl-CoA synthetase (AMP-forming)/AMP-acid ligase II